MPNAHNHSRDDLPTVVSGRTQAQAYWTIFSNRLMDTLNKDWLNEVKLIFDNLDYLLELLHLNHRSKHNISDNHDKVKRIEDRYRQPILDIANDLIVDAEYILKRLVERNWVKLSNFFKKLKGYDKKFNWPTEKRNYDLSWILPYVHYSDPYYKIKRTVFWKKEYGLQYEYSDRLYEFGIEKTNNSQNEADRLFPPKHWSKTFHNIQAYLSAYYWKEVELRHVVVWVNHSNWHSYCIYWFRFKESQEK